MNNTTATIGIIVALLLGGVIGYTMKSGDAALAKDLQVSAVMMKENGELMMQMSRMMSDANDMLRKSTSSPAMMQHTESFAASARMMETKGNTMMQHGTSMMQMMAQ